MTRPKRFIPMTPGLGFRLYARALSFLRMRTVTVSHGYGDAVYRNGRLVRRIIPNSQVFRVRVEA